MTRKNCLLASTCDQRENEKSFSSIDTSHTSIAHGAKTDSDLARPTGSDHPAAQYASEDDITLSTARLWQPTAQQTQPSRSDSDCCTPQLVSRTTRGSRRSWPAEDRALSSLSRAGAELEVNGWWRCTVTHRGGRHSAEPTAGAPTTVVGAPTPAGLLRWTPLLRIYRRCTTASSSRRCIGIRLGGRRRSGCIHWT
jgi:hypothetical protein